MNPSPIIPAGSSQPQKSGLAVASMILGISGIVLCLGPLAGLPGVICGHMAQSRIKRSGGALSGAGMATAGLVLGYLSIAWIFVIGMMAAIAIPNFVKARTQAQYNACRNNLITIEGAKEVWALENKKTATVIPADEEIFGEGKPIKQKPACPAGGIYTLNSVQEAPSCSKHGTVTGRQMR